MGYMMNSLENMISSSGNALTKILGAFDLLSPVVSFTFGALLFREKNLKSKAIDLILVLIGMIFLYLGSKN